MRGTLPKSGPTPTAETGALGEPCIRQPSPQGQILPGVYSDYAQYFAPVFEDGHSPG
jgi:hypothetical protein